MLLFSVIFLGSLLTNSMHFLAYIWRLTANLQQKGMQKWEAFVEEEYVDTPEEFCECRVVPCCGVCLAGTGDLSNYFPIWEDVGFIPVIIRGYPAKRALSAMREHGG